MVEATPQNGLPTAPAASPLGTPSLRDGSSSGSSSLSRCVAVSSSLSPRDKDLLSALANPSTDADAVLATLAPDEVAAWLERPEIQSAIAAAFELREIRLRFKLNAATDRAIDRMTAVFDANKDLADPVQRSETRRAASAIFRLQSRATDRAAYLLSSSPPAFLHAARSVRHAAHRPDVPPLQAPDSGSDRPGSTYAQRLKDVRANITAASAALSSALTGKPRSHSERPPLDTTTPAAAIAGVLAAFKQLPTDGPRAAYDLVERALADPITQQPILKERFLTHLAASPALTARHRPFTADPIQIDGAVATQRIIYTLEDGTRTAALFRAVRRDPKAFESFPTASWQIDCIYPADTS